MKIPYCFALLALLTALPGLAQQKSPRLEGAYRVRGECHERSEDGAYKRCVAWNRLVLKPLATDRYAYTLDTNTFATTQGGCSLEGTVSLQKENDRVYLVASPVDADACPIRFKIDKKALTLDMPEGGDDCQRFCGTNSSLYTDPFPRASRKK
jgi:hypothetical protein